MAGSFEECVRKDAGKREEAMGFEDVHRGNQVGYDCFIS